MVGGWTAPGTLMNKEFPRNIGLESEHRPSHQNREDILAARNHFCALLSRSTVPPVFVVLGTKPPRYKDGTSKVCALAFLAAPYRALQCDRCLVITT